MPPTRRSHSYNSERPTNQCASGGNCCIATDIIARRAKGDSFGMIANALNRQGMASVHGSRWYPASVRALYKKAFSVSKP
ncbi:recombinase family protein [Noviherbaspirillum album]|uniref:recombinase family protein n=1 Tax=Noviherbaspirillum album TaxID=3080276 RepID=UPI003460EA99